MSLRVIELLTYPSEILNYVCQDDRLLKLGSRPALVIHSSSDRESQIRARQYINTRWQGPFERYSRVRTNAKLVPIGHVEFERRTSISCAYCCIPAQNWHGWLYFFNEQMVMRSYAERSTAQAVQKDTNHVHKSMSEAVLGTTRVRVPNRPKQP